MVRKALISDCDALAALWLECFPNDEKLCAVYFRELFDPDRAIVLERDGDLLAALYYQPERLVQPGIGELDAAYLYRVGTAARARGQGLARELMSGAFGILRSEGFTVAEIVPCSDGIFDLYRKFGFAEMFLIERSVEKREKITPRTENIIDLPPERAPECAAMFKAVARWRTHVDRDAWMWTAAAHIEAANGGGVLGIDRDGYLAGYAFYKQTDGGVVIDELFCEDEEAFDALRLAVMDRCAVDELTFCAPACPHGARRFAMIRTLNGEALAAFGLKRRAGDFEIEIDDAELPENALHYTAKDGEVSTRERSSSIGVTPGDFAAIILGGGPSPYMNLVF